MWTFQILKVIDRGQTYWLLKQLVDTGTINRKLLPWIQVIKWMSERSLGESVKKENFDGNLYSDDIEWSFQKL